MKKDDLKEIIITNDDGEFLKHGNVAIHVDTFIDLFGDVEFEHKKLSSHINTTPAWKIIFDEWKEKGILK